MTVGIDMRPGYRESGSGGVGLWSQPAETEILALWDWGLSGQWFVRRAGEGHASPSPR
jgi:hypothetical protein